MYLGSKEIDFVLILANIMVFLLEFEIAFTPLGAKHYPVLKADLLKWQGVQLRRTIRSQYD